MSERTAYLAARVREELAASDRQHCRDLAGMVTDTTDEALASALVDVDAEITDRHVLELRDIESARMRMKHGTYGICIDCGDAHDLRRSASASKNVLTCCFRTKF